VDEDSGGDLPSYKASSSPKEGLKSDLSSNNNNKAKIMESVKKLLIYYSVGCILCHDIV